MDRQAFELLLDEVTTAVGQADVPNIFGDRVKALGAIRKELTNARLKVGVIGVTSSGKSTFLNALLGECLLPEQSKPTSNALAIVRKGPVRQMEVHYLPKSGKPIEVLHDHDISGAHLATYLSEELNRGNSKQIDYVVLESPSVLLSEQFEIVDTPGLDAFGLEWHQSLTLDEFVPQADIIVYMTSIRNPFKRQDFNALNRIVENNQRVVFVMSGMDLEKADTEGGRVVRSREEKLDAQIKRLTQDAAHCAGLATAGFALVDSKSALRSAQSGDSDSWNKSGFPEVLDIFGRFRDNLVSMALESRISRATRHILEIEKTARANLLKAKGSQHESVALANERRELRDALVVAVQQAKHMIDSLPTVPGTKELLSSVSAKRPRKDSDKATFYAYIRACDDTVRELSSRIQTGVAKTKDDLESLVGIFGLEAPRVTFDQVSLDDLPDAKVSEIERTETWQEEKGWSFSLKFWPHTETKSLTITEVDTKTFDRHMDTRVTTGLDRISRHVSRMQQMLQERFITRTMEMELQSVENELFETESGLPYLAANLKALQSLSQKLTVVIRALGLERIDKNGDDEAQNKFFMEEAAATATTTEEAGKGGSESPRVQGAVESWVKSKTVAPHQVHPLASLVGMYRDLQLHHHFLGRFEDLAKSRIGTYHVAIFGMNATERSHLVDLLLHRLHDPLPVPAPDLPVLYVAEAGEIAEDLTGCGTCAMREATFLQRAQILIAPSDDSDVDSRTWETLVKWADIALVLVDGPRIGTGLQDLYRAPYLSSLQERRDSVIYVISHGAKFDDKLPHLATEVIPHLRREGPYGEAAVIVHENYDIRYTDYLSLLGVSRTPEEFERRWRAKRLTMEEPFRSDVLHDLFSNAKHN